MPRSTPIIPGLESVSAGHCWESRGEKKHSQQLIKANEVEPGRRVAVCCAAPPTGEPDDPWQHCADPAAILHFLENTAPCLIELKVAYFRLVLRFPPHRGANIDITSIPLDGVIVLSSCYSLDSGGEAAAVGLSHARVISGSKYDFLMCFSSYIKHRCTLPLDMVAKLKISC